MSRIALVEPNDLTPEQRHAYDTTPSGKLNIFRLLAQARSMGPGLTSLIMAMMTDLTLPAIERELAILAVIHLERGEYEWAQHLQVAAAMGIAKEKVDAIAHDRFGDPVFDDREKAVLAFTRQSVKSVRVDDYVFGALSNSYDSRQIVELIHVIGIYMMLVRITEAAELEVDGVLGAAVWADAAEQKG